MTIALLLALLSTVGTGACAGSVRSYALLVEQKAQLFDALRSGGVVISADDSPGLSHLASSYVNGAVWRHFRMTSSSGRITLRRPDGSVVLGGGYANLVLEGRLCYASGSQPMGSALIEALRLRLRSDDNRLGPIWGGVAVLSDTEFQVTNSGPLTLVAGANVGHLRLWTSIQELNDIQLRVPYTSTTVKRDFHDASGVVLFPTSDAYPLLDVSSMCVVVGRGHFESAPSRAEQPVNVHGERLAGELRRVEFGTLDLKTSYDGAALRADSLVLAGHVLAWDPSARIPVLIRGVLTSREVLAGGAHHPGELVLASVRAVGVELEAPEHVDAPRRPDPTERQLLKLGGLLDPESVRLSAILNTHEALRASRGRSSAYLRLSLTELKSLLDGVLPAAIVSELRLGEQELVAPLKLLVGATDSEGVSLSLAINLAVGTRQSELTFAPSVSFAAIDGPNRWARLDVEGLARAIGHGIEEVASTIRGPLVRVPIDLSVSSGLAIGSITTGTNPQVTLTGSSLRFDYHVLGAVVLISSESIQVLWQVGANP